MYSIRRIHANIIYLPYEHTADAIAGVQNNTRACRLVASQPVGSLYVLVYPPLKTVRTCALPTLPMEPRPEHLPRLPARGAVGPSSSGSVSSTQLEEVLHRPRG